MTSKEAFEEADHALRHLDHKRAREAIAHAVETAPDEPRYKAQQAYILAEIRGTPPHGQGEEFYDEELSMLDTVIRMHPECEPAYYFRGRLLQRVRSHGRAQRDFERAAELNPSNIDAVRALKVYLDRRRKEAEAAEKRKKDEEPKGMFAKLLKKK